MLNLLRSCLPAPLKTRMKKALGLPLTRLHPQWKVLEPIGPVYTPHVVLDIGSHHGWFFHCWKDWCPGAVIHAFEPREEAARTSLDLYGDDPDLTVNTVALGSTPGKGDFHVLRDSRVSSSFLEHDPRTWKEVDFKTGEVETREVEIATVDGYCRDRGIEQVYLMKIDVQGFELEVLRGAGQTLERTDHVFVEAGIQPLYKNAPDFTDTYRYMRGKGFHLMALRVWHRGNHVLMETDMLFRRDGLAPPVDTGIERITTSA